jgi:N-acyl-D-amino-acid deacylase
MRSLIDESYLEIHMRYFTSLAIFTWIVIGSSSVRAELPTSGKPDARYAKFDSVIEQYMQQHDISCATLVLRVNDQMVYQRGFGWSDEAKSKPVQPDAKFRIASLTKPITAAAIDVLIRQKKFTLQSKVFDLLDIKPLPDAKVDPRLRTITIEQLLNHRGGWDKKETSDPAWDFWAIAKAMKLDRPPTPEETVSYMMGQPLDFEPGARRAYSNFGYMILGLVIQKYTDNDYYDFVQKYVLTPNGIIDAVPAHSLQKDSDSREVWYSDEHMVRSAVDPASDRKVPYPYGGFIAEDRYAIGGWAMPAASYAKFMETYALAGDRYQKGKKWLHTGSQPGICTVAIWRKNGEKIVAFFNRRVDGAEVAEQLNAVADEVLGTGAKAR